MRTLVNQGYITEKNRISSSSPAITRKASAIERRRAGGAPRIRFPWSNPHLGLQSIVAATVEPTNVAPPAAAGTSSSAAADAPSAAPAASLPLEFEHLVLRLLPHLAPAYIINPQMITGVDEQLADIMIVEGMISQPDADDSTSWLAATAASSYSASCTRSVTS